ncbi:MAG: ImuA family protein [Parvibaculaceae bacterium]
MNSASPKSVLSSFISDMSGPAPAETKARLIADLRRRIASHKRTEPFAGERVLPPVISTGAAFLDAALPDHGLTAAALHEVRAADYPDMGAGLGFATALAARCAETFPDAPVLWCESTHAPFDMGRLYGPGLAAFGLDPARLILVSPPSPVDLLWTMEEALRLGAFAAVIGEIDGRTRVVNLTTTRRLQLAAEAGGRPALLLTGHTSAGASASATRWSVSSAPSSAAEAAMTAQNMLPSLGRARWSVELEKCRGSQSNTASPLFEQTHQVEWDPRTRLLQDTPVRMATPMHNASQMGQATHAG